MMTLAILGIIPCILIALIIHEGGKIAAVGVTVGLIFLGVVALIILQNWRILLNIDWVIPLCLCIAGAYGWMQLHKNHNSPAPARARGWGRFLTNSGWSREMVARHEAAHAVMVYHHGGKLKGVAIGPGKAKWGVTAFSGCSLSDTELADISLAGPYGEALHTGVSTHKALHYGAGVDGSDHHYFCQEAGPGDDAIGKHERRVRKVIKRRDPRVDALATALIERGSVTGSEAKTIIRNAR